MDTASLESRVPSRRADSYQPPPAGTRSEISLAEVVKPVTVQQNELFEERPPVVENRVLYSAGDLSLLAWPGVAIVGTRNVSKAGAGRAKRLARELVEAGVVIVSGLAKGVDTAALTAAIEAGGRVIAVIGTPLDKAYPAENKRLQEQIYRDHLLISPFPDGERVFQSFFPQRNKVMATLSDATVIIEASNTSGTLHQAAACTKLGRWLFIAKSVIDNPALTWPQDFVRYPTTKTLTNTADVLAVLPR